MEAFALLIANSSPPASLSLPRLQGPQRDAEMLQKALEKRGVATTVLLDASSAQMARAVNTLSNKTGFNDRVIFWYSGHVLIERSQVIPVSPSTNRERLLLTFDKLLNPLDGQLFVLIDAYGSLGPKPSKLELVPNHTCIISGCEQLTRRSVFTRHLVAAIQGDTVQGSAGPKPVSTTRDLATYMTAKLRDTGIAVHVQMMDNGEDLLTPEYSKAIKPSAKRHAKKSFKKKASKRGAKKTSKKTTSEKPPSEASVGYSRPPSPSSAPSAFPPYRPRQLETDAFPGSGYYRPALPPQPHTALPLPPHTPARPSAFPPLTPSTPHTAFPASPSEDPYPAAPPLPPDQESPPYAVVVSEDNRTLPRIYKVWFGTNRNLLPDASGQIPFGIDRDKEIHYGVCEVNIPKSHRIGSIGSDWWTRLKTWTDDRLKLLSTTVQQSELYWSGIVDELRDLPRQSQMALIYIHGFNVTFEGAAIRAAQIGFDLEVPGLTAFFSWPSKGSVAGYIADGDRVNASEKAMTEFIRGFVDKANVDQVHILAHSMGNRALLRSIERVVEGLTKKVRRRIGQVILAAPDVGCDEFCDLAVVYKKIAKRTTMYVSAKDLALRSSGIINEYARAGFVPPVTVVPGIDTIEATNVDLTLLGHSHYAEARALIMDMNVLINSGAPPMKRHGLLRLKTDDGQVYWQVRG